MKREDFKKIIKLRSCWKIDKRCGNYKLPSGRRLEWYVRDLVISQMKVDHLGIRENGDLAFSGEVVDDKVTLVIPFQESEECSVETQIERIDSLVREMVGWRIVRE